MRGSVDAILIDYGGVFTIKASDAVKLWHRADNIDPASFRAVMRDWLGGRSSEPITPNPLQQVEVGEITASEFASQLAARLRTRSGEPVVSDGLLERMFSGFRPEPAMVKMLRAARVHGLRTGLLSNSWGNRYPVEDWEGLFDVVVISEEVGLRKPDQAIYRLAAERLAVPTSACVFVDDLPANVAGAEVAGMTGVLHRDAASSVSTLEDLVGKPLR